jgi:FkbM family methyltransferase
MDKLDVNKFDWGWMDNNPGHLVLSPQGEVVTLGQFHKEAIIYEVFENNIYEKFFEVEEGDVVLDIGSSNGPFTYSILHKKPKHVFCMEPSQIEFPTLIKNTIGYPVTQINKGLHIKNENIINYAVFGNNNYMEGITFKSLIELYSLDKIDFLKTDCEGAEYYIFTEENKDYVVSNIRKIAGEWHLETPEQKELFRNFRDNFLKLFNNFNVFSVDGANIKWDLWNEHFIEYYNQVIVYIDNR